MKVFMFCELDYIATAEILFTIQHLNGLCVLHITNMVVSASAYYEGTVTQFKDIPRVSNFVIKTTLI